MRMPNANTGMALKTDRQLPLSIGKPIATITPMTKIAMMMTRHRVSVLDVAGAGVGSLTYPLSIWSLPHTVPGQRVVRLLRAPEGVASDGGFG